MQQKWCYASEQTDEKLKCAMDYKNEKRREFEKLFCKHLRNGEDKETCEFYLVAKKYR